MFMMIHLSSSSFMMIRTILFIGLIFEISGFIPKATGMALNQDTDVRYASSMNIDEVMGHLQAFENIAKGTTGRNRAVKTPGFNQTLDYITNYLSLNTNLKVTKSFFNMRTFQLLSTPTLSSTINGVVKTHTYSTNLAVAEFYRVQYSTSANINSNTLLTAIPNFGCSDADWLAASPSPAGLVALVKRGDCTFESKALLATKYNVAALLLYNNGTTGNIQPIDVSLGQNNRVPALFLSYTLGQSLANTANDPSKVATVRLSIVTDNALNPVGNICADTLTGDPTQTILIGSHSDSVTAGAGINDNGSGSAGNLALATTLSRLLQTPDYPAYKYRVRFCWWGAEELGLIGSDFHVSEAKKSSEIGERIKDYLVNINLDMIGSPNFIFGIYNGNTAPTNTPASARPGSNKMTTLFQGWFDDNKLPRDPTNFDGRSDYGPFLAAGVAAGGLFTGADGSKTVEQRNRYAAMLGSGLGGTSGIRYDINYHRVGDNMANINKFALDKMVQASAFAIESLGRQDDLKSWLYPTREIEEISKQSEHEQKYEYDSINEYFGLPYY